jgi:hypothetical protein
MWSLSHSVVVSGGDTVITNDDHKEDFLTTVTS